MSITSIKKRARAGTLEVEHLLKEANYPDAELAAALEDLSAEMQWHTVGLQPDGTLYVPLATWTKVVATYCREGHAGLIRLSSEPDLADFILAVFVELRTNEALGALMVAYKDCLGAPCRDCDIASRIAAALNLMLSFKPNADADAAQAAELQAFLLGLYACAEDDHQRALALLALRGIGDEASAAFAHAQRLSENWQDTPKLVARQIRKRLRAAAKIGAETGNN